MVVESFTALETYLGREYLDAIKGRGSMTVLPLIELGFILQEVGPLDKAASLINRFKWNDRSARFEGMMIAFYRRQGLPVTIEPAVLFEGEVKRPDFLVEYRGENIFVEVSSPITSTEGRRINDLVAYIANVSERIDQPRRVDVTLLREPSAGEIEQIRATCVAISVDDVQPRYADMGDIGVIVSRQLPDTETNRLLNPEDLMFFPSGMREKYRGTPYLFQLSLKVGGYPTQTTCRVHVAYPFTDVRLERILSEERERLSPSTHNMIVLDVSDIPGVFSSRNSNWIQLVQRRLQPQLNRRIGAVLLVTTGVDSTKIIVEKHLVEHPNPYHRLPEGFIETTLQSEFWGAGEVCLS